MNLYLTRWEGWPASQKDNYAIITEFFYRPGQPGLSLVAGHVMRATAMVLACLGASVPGVGQDIVAYGDLRGYVEPCGCDPETDLGGLARLYQVVGELRQQVAKGIVVDLGYNLPITGDLAHASSAVQAKAKGIAAGLAVVGTDAALATPRDLAYFLSHSLAKGKKPSPRHKPWLLSNQRHLPKALKGVVRRSIAAKRYVVLGVVDPLSPRSQPLPHALKASYAPIDEALVKTMRSLTKARVNHKVVILYDGRNQGLSLLKQGFPKATFIRTNLRPNDALADQKEKEQPGLLFRQGVYSVPSFGQGVITLGAFRAAPLNLGASSTSTPGALGSGSLGSGSLGSGASGAWGGGASSSTAGGMAVLGGLPVPPFKWLSKQYALDVTKSADPMVQVLEAYRQGTQGAFNAEVQKKLQARKGKTSPYAGDKACRTCHPQAYKVYASSAHARAMATLEGKNQQRNGECVSCHVVGYDQPGGYIDEQHTPELANVQCEVCHGPRKAHVLNPTVKPPHQAASEVCVSCHHVPHSSNFDYQTYWAKIFHGKPTASAPTAPAAPSAPTSTEATLLPEFGQKPRGSRGGTSPVLGGPKYGGDCQPGRPVCGVKNGAKQTYADRCAMAKGGAELCHEGACFEFCTTQYDPACGQIGGKFRTFSNSCVLLLSCAQPAPASSCGL